VAVLEEQAATQALDTAVRVVAEVAQDLHLEMDLLEETELVTPQVLVLAELAAALAVLVAMVLHIVQLRTQQAPAAAVLVVRDLMEVHREMAAHLAVLVVRQGEAEIVPMLADTEDQ
jgi:hypothetical protein